VIKTHCATETVTENYLHTLTIKSTAAAESLLIHHHHHHHQIKPVSGADDWLI